MATTTSALLFTIVALVAVHGTSSQSITDGLTNNITAWQIKYRDVVANATNIGDDVRARFNQSIQDGVKEIQKLVKEANDTGIDVDDCIKGLPEVGQAISMNIRDANTDCSKKALADLQPDINNLRNGIEAAQKAFQEARTKVAACGFFQFTCVVKILIDLTPNIAKYNKAIPQAIVTLKIHAAGAAVNRALCEGKALSSAQQSIKAAVDSTSSCVREKTAVTTNPQ